MNINHYEERPWGSFEILLDEDYCKVKRIIVKPKCRLSYQYHHKRSEVWVVVQGEACATINNPNGVSYEECTYGVGEVIEIPIEARHRVQNNGKEDLIFIETQVGTYFGEDDIVRLEDDYGRNSED